MNKINKNIQGPIIDRGKPRGKKMIFVVLAGVLLVMGFIGFLFVDKNQTEMQEMEENMPVLLEELPPEIEANEIDLDQSIEKEEEGTAEYYYNRALEKEKEKDYNGAVEDYSKAIGVADRYSSEMWNSLNNRGIIYTEQLKEYHAALSDFSMIIRIETNRTSGEINTTRLESGYTNRAYVKKIKGDKKGACEDLNEALYLGIESSRAFIEKQIDKNCQ